MGCGVSSSEAKYSASSEASAGGSAAKSSEPANSSAATTQAASQASTEDGAAETAPAEELPEEAGALAWWSIDTDWIRDSSHEIFNGYSFFFEHIGIRKGWRTPPFKKEDVQAPFMASAEVVAVVRHRIDEQGNGMVLRQLEGSSHDWLWGWSPEKPPHQAEFLPEFFRGLVFATLSDANGLVEGLDAATLDYYVQSHPILEGCPAPVAPAPAEHSAPEEGAGPASGAAEGASEPEKPGPEKAEASSIPKDDLGVASPMAKADTPEAEPMHADVKVTTVATVPPDAAQTPKTQDVGEADPKVTSETAQDAGGASDVAATTPAADAPSPAPLMLANGPAGAR